jgi:hypothetical protein
MRAAIFALTLSAPIAAQHITLPAHALPDRPGNYSIMWETSPPGPVPAPRPARLGFAFSDVPEGRYGRLEMRCSFVAGETQAEAMAFSYGDLWALVTDEPLEQWLAAWPGSPYYAPPLRGQTSNSHPELQHLASFGLGQFGGTQRTVPERMSASNAEPWSIAIDFDNPLVVDHNDGDVVQFYIRLVEAVGRVRLDSHQSNVGGGYTAMKFSSPSDPCHNIEQRVLFGHVGEMRYQAGWNMVEFGIGQTGGLPAQPGDLDLTLLGLASSSPVVVGTICDIYSAGEIATSTNGSFALPYPVGLWRYGFGFDFAAQTVRFDSNLDAVGVAGEHRFQIPRASLLEGTIPDFSGTPDYSGVIRSTMVEAPSIRLSVLPSQ